MTRRRSSPLGLELVLSVVLALVVLPLLSHGAPVQDGHADLQRYSEGCYYNYNHYSEGDRILTNEPCLNCTCHNKMLMCYLRVCPFTKPIGHDCTIEKREDQCCPIITCPEVPVDVTQHNNQLITHTPGTELSIPEKYGCSIDRKFYPEGAQVPSNPNKPCELCYCIRNRTSCLMQECTLHIDGCQPIYNKGSCCPVRYNCDHENELLELEDYSTTTTTVRPTPGYVLSSTTSPLVTTDCVHNNEVYADGASITGKSACEHCYCMRGDIVCAVQECEMPTLESGAKTCRALPPAAGECCPSNYICDDDTVSTEATLIDQTLTTISPKIQGNLHESVSQEDVQLQEHIDDKIAATETPEKLPEQTDSEQGSKTDAISTQTVATTVAPIPAEVTLEDKKPLEEEETPVITTESIIKETSYKPTQSPIELTTTHKTEESLEDSHIIIGQDKEYDSTQAPIEDEIIAENKDVTTIAPIIEETQKEEDELVSAVDESAEEEVEIEKDAITTTASIIEFIEPEIPSVGGKPIEKDVDTQKPEVLIDATTITSIESIEKDSDKEEKVQTTETPLKTDLLPDHSAEQELSSTTAPSKVHTQPDTSVDELESSSESIKPSEEAPTDQAEGQDKIDQPLVETSFDSTTVSSVYEMVTQGEDSDIVMPAIEDHKYEPVDHEKKPIDEAPIVPAVSASDDVKNDDLPQVTAISEQEEISTLKPLPTEISLKPEAPETDVVLPDDVSDEDETIATIKPSTEREESQPDKSTEGVVAEDIEVPAVIHEITETSSEHTSEIVPKDEEDTAYQTTAHPAKDSEADDVIESGEEEEDNQKETQEITTDLPVGIIIEQEETTSKDSVIDSKGTTEQDKEDTEQVTDSTTIAPTIADAKVPSIDEEKTKVQPEPGTTDSTFIAPSLAESGVLSAEDVSSEVSPEEQTTSPPKPSETKDSTTASTSLSGGEQTFSEEEIDQEQEQKQPELSVTDSTIIAPSVTDSEEESPNAEEENITKKPELGITDSTFIAPSLADSGVLTTKDDQSLEDSSEQLPPSPLKPSLPKDSTTSAPSIASGETFSAEEIDKEEDKKQPELVITDSTTISPFDTDSEEEIKKQPEQSTSESVTTPPSVAESATIIPSVSLSEIITTNEEEIKTQPEQNIADLTTLAPAIVDSEASIAEEEDKRKSEQAVVDSTTITPSVADSNATEGEKIKDQPEQGITDSTFLAPSLTGVLSAEDEQSSEVSSEETTSVPSTVSIHKDSTTSTPSLSGGEETFSEEEVDKEEDKKQPELIITDSTTIAPSSVDSEVSTQGEGEEIKEQPEESTADSTTTAPSVADSETSSVEKEEEDKEQTELGITDSTIVAPISVGSETSSVEEEQVKVQPGQGITDSTTSAPDAIESEQPSAVDADKRKPEQESTVSPIADEESLEVVGAAEGSGDHTQEIIPSAIPGEGDCLVDDRTFAHNATVPTSSECEISCNCMSSIVVCQRVQCYEPPQPNNCILDEASTDRCCPQYICGVDSFAEDQRPVTAEDIEDEEIHFTTLPPAVKYPAVSGVPEIELEGSVKPAATTVTSIVESEVEGSGEVYSDRTTGKPEEELTKPLQVGEEATVAPVKKPTIGDTEQPASTPSYVDIELPVIATEQPMSHVKDDEVQEESTELSSLAEGSGEEEKSTERPYTSDQKIQPLPSITGKPTQEITDDGEKPAHVTALPDLGVPSKKPSVLEESTTLQAADEEGTESATVAPSEQGISASDDTVIVDTETTSSVGLGAPKIDESIFTTDSTIEVDSTTTAPIKSEAASEAPSLTSILDLEGVDSSQSEETPEISEQGTKESGEETIDSEESTKSPLDVQVTTTRPILSEQSTIKTIHTDLTGEITHPETSTIIPEIDYQKPEMPEDMSHIKIESELPLETITKKPVEPVSTEESDESKESEENTEKTSEIVPSPMAPISTVLTPVKPSEKDQETVDTTSPIIYDKKDEFPETEDSIFEKEGPKPLPSTPSPATSEEELLSGTVATSSGELEKDELASQTSSPIDKEQAISGTVAPVESSDKKDKPTSQASIPSIEEKPLSGTVASISEEGAELGIDEIVSQTSTPIVEEYPISAEGPELGKDELASQTSSPIDEEQAISGTVAPVESSDKKDKTSSLPGTVAPILEEGAELGIDEIVSQTSAPIVEEHPISAEGPELGKDELASQTSSPIDEEQAISGTVAPVESSDKKDKTSSLPGTVAPILEEGAELGIDEIVSQTSAPVVEEHPISAEGPELGKDELASQTSSPIDEEQAISGTVTPVESSDKKDKPTSQDSIPSIEEKPLSGTDAPILEEEAELGIDEIVSQTNAPIIKEGPELEKDEEQPISETGAPISDDELEVPSTIAPISGDESIVEKDQSVDHTSAPSIEKQPLPVRDTENKSEIEKGETNAEQPQHILDEGMIPEAVSPTTLSSALEEAGLSSTISSSEEEEEEEELVSETARPSADKQPSVQIPLEENEKEADITTVSTPIKTVEVEDESLDTTKAPVKTTEAEGEHLDTAEPAAGVGAGSNDVDASEDSATSSPIAEEADESLHTTEAPIKTFEKEEESSTIEQDESLGGTEETPSAVQTSESESASPSTIPISATEEQKKDGSADSPASTDTTLSKTDRGSEEELEPELATEQSLSPIEETVLEEKPHTDETLLATESPLPEGETVHSLHIGEEPSAGTDKPISIEDESSTESGGQTSSIDVAAVTDVVVIDEVTSQPGKPDSDDQISVHGVSTESTKLVDEIPTQTDSSIDINGIAEQKPSKPSAEETLSENGRPVTVDVSETDATLAQTEKPVSAEDVVTVDAGAASEDSTDETKIPISVPSISKEEDISTQTAKPEGSEIPAQTDQSILAEESDVPVSNVQQIIKDTTGKPVEDTSASESEEEEEQKEVVSTIASVDLAQTSTPSSTTPVASILSEETTESSEESEVESEHTEDDVKIQTIAEFVTERGDELPTELPTQDVKKEKIPEKPITTSSEEEENLEVNIATEKVSAVPAQSEEITPSFQIPSEVPQQGQKSELRPTESALPSPTSEKPIVKVDEKFDTDLPKPIATYEGTNEELPTTVQSLLPSIELDRTTLPPTINANDKIDNETNVSESTARPAYTSSSTLAPTKDQPTTVHSVTSAPTSHYQPQQPSYGHVPPQYPSYTEDEYTDEDESEVFGPGTCRYGGKLFVSAQQIPRDDPCDFCFCFRSDIICLQQSCPPPISGCHEEPISGFCCPRYECPVSMATVLNITTSTTTTSTTLPPHFLHHAYRGAAEKNGCHINGKSYKVGDPIDSASGPCMHCTCGGDGQMKCDPKTCSPEPMLRQMIAVVASRRR